MTCSTSKRGLVIFHDYGRHWTAFILKKGFKHCFCAVQTDGYWVEIHNGEQGTILKVVTGTDYDLKTYYENHSCKVLEVEQGGPSNLPFALSNCVGLTKTALGLQYFGALTPYQLYKRILKSHAYF